MLKSQRAAYVALAGALDVLALFSAFAVAWALRESLGDFLVWAGHGFHYHLEGWVRHSKDLPEVYRIVLSPNPLVNTREHLWIVYLSIPSWLFFLHMQGAYDPQAQRNGRQEFALCAYAGMLGTVVLMVLMVLSKMDVSRLLLVGYLLTGTCGLWFDRAVVLPLILRRSGQPIRHLVVIGNAEAAQRFVDILNTPAYRGSHLLGFISEHDAGASDTVRHLGRLADLATVLDREVVDEVILVRSQTDTFAVNDTAQPWGDILELCLQRGRTVSLVDDIVPPVGAKVEATMLGALPTLVLHNTPQNTLGLAVKSVIDRTCRRRAGPVICHPGACAVIALAIKLTSAGPVFFKQQRVGLNGRLFNFYKFRSMVINAEEILEQHRAEWEQHNKMSGGFFKWEDDPRITKVGRFMRKYSLDELPQFWNVLRGDMSLVGPRPPLPKEVAQLQPWQRRKLSVKGGLTCLWQVSGRNEIDTDEWMRLDLEYIDNWSLWLDVKLLFQTVKVLVRPRGAELVLATEMGFGVWGSGSGV